MNIQSRTEIGQDIIRVMLVDDDDRNVHDEARVGEHAEIRGEQHTEAGCDGTAERRAPVLLRVRSSQRYIERHSAEWIDNGEQRCERQYRELQVHARALAMHSISTRAPSGSPLTPTAERAGGAESKKRPYTAFIAS